jgi:hypothetical protein
MVPLPFSWIDREAARAIHGSMQDRGLLPIPGRDGYAAPLKPDQNFTIRAAASGMPWASSTRSA